MTAVFLFVGVNIIVCVIFRLADDAAGERLFWSLLMSQSVSCTPLISCLSFCLVVNLAATVLCDITFSLRSEKSTALYPCADQTGGRSGRRGDDTREYTLPDVSYKILGWIDFREHFNFFKFYAIIRPFLKV